jgi:hypothetical protein
MHDAWTEKMDLAAMRQADGLPSGCLSTRARKRHADRTQVRRAAAGGARTRPPTTEGEPREKQRRRTGGSRRRAGGAYAC